MALSRSQKKVAAIERARRRLQHRLEDIDWELDELQPKLRQIGELEKTHTVELEAGPEDLGEDQD